MSTPASTEPGPPAQTGKCVSHELPTGDALTARYLLHLADDALVYAQRLGEWIANAPEIEEDMALANVSLDLLGQARALYTRAGELDGTGRNEDELAYFRDEREFRNAHLVEQERGDFADEMARLLVFSAYQVVLYDTLTGSCEPTLAGVAGKAIKEADYHRDHATQWVLRLGAGTPESHQRMQAALDRVMPYVVELFDDDPVSVAAADSGAGVLPSALGEPALTYLSAVVTQATLTMPVEPGWHARGGRAGVHSRPMGFLLAEMQHLARSHPGATW